MLFFPGMNQSFKQNILALESSFNHLTGWHVLIFEIQKTPWNQLADVQTLALLGARLLLWTDTTLSLPSEEPVMIPSWQTASQCGEAYCKMLDHFDEFKSRKAMQFRRNHKVKIRCLEKNTPLFPKQAWNIRKDKLQLQSNNHGLCNLHHSINRHGMTLDAILVVSPSRVGPCAPKKKVQLDVGSKW